MTAVDGQHTGNDHTAITNGGGKTTVDGQHTGNDHTAITNGGGMTTVDGQHTGNDHTAITNGGGKTTVDGQHTGNDHTAITNGGGMTTVDGQHTGQDQADDGDNGGEATPGTAATGRTERTPPIGLSGSWGEAAPRSCSGLSSPIRGSSSTATVAASGRSEGSNARHASITFARAGGVSLGSASWVQESCGNR